MFKLVLACRCTEYSPMAYLSNSARTSASVFQQTSGEAGYWQDISQMPAEPSTWTASLELAMLGHYRGSPSQGLLGSPAPWNALLPVTGLGGFQFPPLYVQQQALTQQLQWGGSLHTWPPTMLRTLGQGQPELGQQAIVFTEQPQQAQPELPQRLTDPRQHSANSCRITQPACSSGWRLSSELHPAQAPTLLSASELGASSRGSWLSGTEWQRIAGGHGQHEAKTSKPDSTGRMRQNRSAAARWMLGAALPKWPEKQERGKRSKRTRLVYAESGALQDRCAAGEETLMQYDLSWCY